LICHLPSSLAVRKISIAVIMLYAYPLDHQKWYGMGVKINGS